MAQTIYDFTCNTLNGKPQTLSDYRGKVALIVNTASKCGFTPQYKGLEELYKKYKDKGLVILGFPCDQFGHQEPGGSSEISQFCEMNYGVSFPMYEKIEVNGKGAHPLYVYLKDQAPGILGSKAIKWNFTKFLVGRNGEVIRRYASATKPKDIEQDIEKLLS
ncbi:MAG TPA: glutathione peroxidase [Pseudomonadales bacterium]|nr:glutathione peroxidase [Pseudomonadales bacterium]